MPYFDPSYFTGVTNRATLSPAEPDLMEQARHWNQIGAEDWMASQAALRAAPSNALDTAAFQQQYAPTAKLSGENLSSYLQGGRFAGTEEQFFNDPRLRTATPGEAAELFQHLFGHSVGDYGLVKRHGPTMT